ncbi:MAG: hypothetical protein COA86_10870 [Kangiella sp.]|nr:MAG: hypothetical protein COA86_10870 [Kangiella sp.]
MAILYWLDLQSAILESVIDGSILAVISAPFIYYFLIKDLSNKNENLVESLRKQKLAEDALITSQGELQIISEKLINSEEAQRKALAFELHDGIGQSIFAIKLGIENILTEYDGEMSVKLNQCLLKEVIKLKNAAEEIRHISVNLRPAMLEDLGLLTTLKWLSREFQQLFPQIDFELELNIEESEIPDYLKVVIFRISQESLTNIGKHAEAKKVHISIKRSKGIVLTVKDDGQGFIQSKNIPNGGFGLSSMQERAKHSRGEFNLTSSANDGTSVVVVWKHLQN